jgi:micrococcal nuclease
MNTDTKMVARLSAVVIAIALTGIAAVHAIPDVAEVVDGDTVRHKGGQLIRLQGFNTPETSQAECQAELDLGRRAKRRLQDLLSRGPYTLTLNPGSCGYGRACGTLAVNGTDVGVILVNEGLAERFTCRGNICPKRRRWC